LAPVARIAVQHRERLDGFGYLARALRRLNVPRGAHPAAADAYLAMR
jgi:hypothetical protein